ncbi:hypothetical protein SAMN05720467_2162 [Fibrobacter sp. UWB7]|nr:hypothetical protein SAMN05720467_2162 [Fibrobacter sp. UWB7]
MFILAEVPVKLLNVDDYHFQKLETFVNSRDGDEYDYVLQ